MLSVNMCLHSSMQQENIVEDAKLWEMSFVYTLVNVLTIME